jgi:predicted O-methyltransferase YrrM
MFAGWHNPASRSKAQYKGVVATAQVAWELNELIRIYDELSPCHVLEIGTQEGGTLYHWLDGAKPGARIVNIDILQNQEPEAIKRLPDMWQSWVPKGVLLNTIIGRSDDAHVFNTVRIWLAPIDFLFIDACHTYEGAKQDFNTYGPLVRAGGIIAMHDLVTPETSPHIQVWQLWREIQAAGYKTRELRAGGSFGGIGVIYVG